jgi:hypothetical protein
MSNLKRKHESIEKAASKASNNLLEGKFLRNSWNNPIQEFTTIFKVDFVDKKLTWKERVKNETK